MSPRTPLAPCWLLTVPARRAGVAVRATVHEGLLSLVGVHRTGVRPGRTGRPGDLPEFVGGQRRDRLDPLGVLGAVDPAALSFLTWRWSR